MAKLWRLTSKSELLKSMRVKLLLAMRSHQKSRMITGIVNADFEPTISLSVCGSDGKIYTQDAIDAIVE